MADHRFFPKLFYSCCACPCLSDCLHLGGKGEAVPHFPEVRQCHRICFLNSIETLKFKVFFHCYQNSKNSCRNLRLNELLLSKLTFPPALSENIPSHFISPHAAHSAVFDSCKHWSMEICSECSLYLLGYCSRLFGWVFFKLRKYKIIFHT